ncbi:MAG: esterase-like activity of phytase family protein [Bacteroidetes bacterium]|nr:esterase-like activity of phytase family protein [Bacteroidota bacterium]
MMRLLFFISFLPAYCFGFIRPVETDTSIVSLRFINEYILPNNLIFDSTRVGGLSGIDYDPIDDVYYLISDDRSAINPARFYKAKIILDKTGIDSVRFIEKNFLQQANGQKYPSAKQDKAHNPDPESMRYHRAAHCLVWTSEGERTTLNQPSVNIITTEGKLTGSYPLPKNLEMTASEKGLRQNGSLESITFSSDFRALFTANEEPLYEDGPRAEVAPTKSWSRIFKFDVKRKENTAQYAYALEPVAYPASPIDAFKVNGISEMLYTSKNKLLVVERSYSTGRVSCTIKIFEADLGRARDVKGINSLTQHPPVHPVAKRLLLNLNDLGIYIDNIEGVTFGPRLPNGHRTLIFVSDNNFNPFQRTQFLLFEVIEEAR